MSTKIHNGYRVPMTELIDARHFLEVFRARATPVFRELLAQRMATIATAHIDRRACGGLPETGLPGEAPPTFAANERPVSYAWGVVTDRIRRAREIWRADQLYDPACDLECTLHLVPYTDGHAYLLLYARQDAYEGVLSGMDGVEPYPYWDNTDPPDGISDAEWDARGALWDTVLPSSVPSNHGWSLELVGRRVYEKPSMEEVLRQVPALPARADALADGYAYRRFIEALDASDAQSADEAAGTEAGLAPQSRSESWHMRRVMAYARWKRADGAAYLDQARAIVAGRLKAALSADDLRSWAPAGDDLSGAIPPLPPSAGVSTAD